MTSFCKHGCGIQITLQTFRKRVRGTQLKMPLFDMKKLTFRNRSRKTRVRMQTFGKSGRWAQVKMQARHGTYVNMQSFRKQGREAKCRLFASKATCTIEMQTCRTQAHRTRVQTIRFGSKAAGPSNNADWSQARPWDPVENATFSQARPQRNFSQARLRGPSKHVIFS